MPKAVIRKVLLPVRISHREVAHLWDPASVLGYQP